MKESVRPDGNTMQNETSLWETVCCGNFNRISAHARAHILVMSGNRKSNVRKRERERDPHALYLVFIIIMILNKMQTSFATPNPG